MDRRTFLRGGLVAVTSVAGGSFLVACGNDETQGSGGGGRSPANLKNLVYVTPFQHIISHGDVYVAIQEGYFEEEGLLITPVGGTGTATSVTQVVADQGMFGKAAQIVTGPLVADQGAEIIHIGQKDQKSQYSVASDPGNPLTHPSQWQGKSIGVISLGGATELLLDAMSVTEGLDPTKVNKIVTGADVSSLEFLRRGEVDGFITYVGSETALREMDVELNYLNSDEFAPMPGDSYFVKKADAEERAEDVIGFLRACRRGWEFMADEANLDRVLSAVGEFNSIEVQDEDLAAAKVKAEVAISTPENGKFLSLDVADWEQGLEIMRQAGIVKDKSKPITDFVTSELVDSA